MTSGGGGRGDTKKNGFFSFSLSPEANKLLSTRFYLSKSTSM